MAANTPSHHLPPQTSHHHWLLGDIPELRRDMLSWMHNSFAEVGPTYRGRLLRRKIYITKDPAAVKHVLQDNNKNYKKSFGYDILKLFLGQGLLTSEGDFWLRQRRLAQPAFHRKRLEALSKVMTEESAVWAEKWAKIRKEGGTVDINEEMMAVTMRIVARALFSANVDDDIPVIGKNMALLNDFAMDRIQSPFPTPTWIPTPRRKAFKNATSRVDSVIYRIIESRRGHTEKYDDLLSMLMEVQDEETGEQMTNLQLRDECMTIFVAGHETTAVSMSWIFDLLSRHPEKLKNLQDELNSVLGGRPPALEDLSRLVYTRYVIDEALRLYPPGWVIGRKSLGEDELSGFHVEKDTNILLNAYESHRIPELWDRPLDFVPERWGKPSIKELPRFAYYPFGGGPRLCIGNNFALMEMTFLLAALAQGNAFIPTQERPIAMDPLITLRPGEAIRLKL
jgi:cytochrome P450